MKNLGFVIVLFSGFSWGVRAVAASAIIVDIVSPATCEREFSKLYKCKFGAGPFRSISVQAPIPYKTTFKTVIEGNCATAFPLQAIVVTSNGANQTISMLAQTETVLRLQPTLLGDFSIKDPRPEMTQRATFDETCRLSLQIQINEPDFKNSEEAVKFVGEKVIAIVESDESKQALEELLSYQAVFSAMQAIAQLFHQQITAQYVDEVKVRSQKIKVLLEKIKNNTNLDLSKSDKDLIERFDEFLEALEVPSSWKGKKFENFFSDEDRLTLERFSKNLEKRSKYEELYKKFTLRFISLCQELLKVKAALSAVLEKKDWQPFRSVINQCENR